MSQVVTSQSLAASFENMAAIALRVKKERDAFEAALLAISTGRHLFGHRLRQIARDAITEAAQL